MQWGARARVGPLWFTCFWAILSPFFLISLRGTQSLRNSGSEVPDALNSDSPRARRGTVPPSFRPRPRALLAVPPTALRRSRVSVLAKGLSARGDKATAKPAQN